MLHSPSANARIDHMETMHCVGVIHLTNGGFTIVDEDRLEELNVRRWSQCKGYVVSGYRVGKKTIPMRMHRTIMRAEKGQSVDHRNRDTLDNRVSNLRFATKSQNAANSKKMIRPTIAGRLQSQFKGVTWEKGAWTACTNGKYIGRFQSEIEAAKAYNVAALKCFGEFARLNEIP